MQGSTSYKEAQLSQSGRATHVDPTYVSTGDAWFDGSAVLARIGRIGAFGSGRSLPLRQISHGKGQPLLSQLIKS